MYEVAFFSLRKKKNVSMKTEHEAGKVRVVYGSTGEQLCLYFNISLFNVDWINARFVIGQKP